MDANTVSHNEAIDLALNLIDVVWRDQSEASALALDDKSLSQVARDGLISINADPPPRFVLTAQGIELLRCVRDVTTRATKALPRWDSVSRVLYYGNTTLKRFARPAPNQELVLTVFEESGWSRCIYDPLPPVGDVVPATRLRETVKSLNRTLASNRIVFSTDGHATGVCWRRQT